jgi:hypothetical protein
MYCIANLEVNLIQSLCVSLNPFDVYFRYVCFLQEYLSKDGSAIVSPLFVPTYIVSHLLISRPIGN